MTYDPHGRERPNILRKHDDSMSGAWTGGIAVALLLLFGVAIFALSSRDRDIVAKDSPRSERTTPAPSTTGQSNQVMPGRDQNVPNPQPPASPPPSGGTSK